MCARKGHSTRTNVASVEGRQHDERITFSSCLVGSTCGCNGHVQSNARALPYLTGDLDATAMQGSDTLDDGESKASAAGALRAGRVDTEETVEDPG